MIDPDSSQAAASTKDVQDEDHNGHHDDNGGPLHQFEVFVLLQALPPGQVLDWLYLDWLCISGVLEAVVVILAEWLNLNAVELLCTVSRV